MNLRTKIYSVFGVIEGTLCIFLVILMFFSKGKIKQFFTLTIVILMIALIPLSLLIMKKYFPSIYEQEMANMVKIRSLKKNKKIGALIGIIISSSSIVSYFIFGYALIFFNNRYLLDNKDLVETILLGLMVFGIVFSGFFLVEKKKK